MSLTCALTTLAGCGPPMPPSKPISELTPQEARGYQVFQQSCARCHHAYSEHGLRGPGLQHLFKHKYLPSGAPANDDRVSEAFLHGRGMMPAFGNKLDDQQVQDLMVYLHTL
uniref:Cytochrome c n=1 Tax=Paracidobacterium acidisoli TaxID=2303751 RepID=A0A372INQ0_9BACT